MVSLGAPALYEKNTKGGTQFRSGAQSCPTPCDPMNHSTPGLPVHHQLPESTQTHVHWVNDAIQPSHPLLYPSPQSFPASGSFPLWVSSSHQVAEVLEFQLQHQSSNGHPGLISFKMDWLDLLAVQGTLKSLLQHHSSKASILSAQLSSQSNSHIHTFHSLLLYSNNHNLLKIINLFYIHRLTWSHNPELFEGQIYFNDFQIVRVDIKCLLV